MTDRCKTCGELDFYAYGHMGLCQPCFDTAMSHKPTEETA